MLQNKLVVAHVLAHSDFFKQQRLLRAHQSRSMVETVSVNAERIRAVRVRARAATRSRASSTRCSRSRSTSTRTCTSAAETSAEHERAAPSAAEQPYDDLLGVGSEQPTPSAPPAPREAHARRSRRRTCCCFLAEHAPDLEDWQRDVARDRADGDALLRAADADQDHERRLGAYWHARIMRELELTDRTSTSSSPRMHSGVLAPSRRGINPYHVGLKIFEDIERRWDEPTDGGAAAAAARSRRQGRAKIFEVRELENDVSFLRNYLTKELVDELDLYLYERRGRRVGRSWRRTGRRCATTSLASMTNFGQPYIVVEDGDYHRRRASCTCGTASRARSSTWATRRRRSARSSGSGAAGAPRDRDRRQASRPDVRRREEQQPRGRFVIDRLRGGEVYWIPRVA